MAKQSTFAKLLDRSSIELSDLQRKSTGWFNKRISEFTDVKSMREERFMSGDVSLKTNTIMPGEMYMFVYQAKGAADLPYWDRFPLVFPFSKTQNSFHALTLHYLPYKYRAVLLDRLMDFSTDSSLSKDTRLKLKWQTISSFSKFGYAQVCVKQYLFSHVRSQFKRVLPEDWASAILLPTERFQGANTSAVWNDTIRKLKQSGVI